jgi:hypothetical protein
VTGYSEIIRLRTVLNPDLSRYRKLGYRDPHLRSKGLVTWVHIDTDRGGIAGSICVECLKRIIDRSECVMEVTAEFRSASVPDPMGIAR